MMVQTKVRVESAYSQKFEVKVGVHQGFVLRHSCLQKLWKLLQKMQEGLMSYCMQMTSLELKGGHGM